MNIAPMLSELRQEQRRIEAAISALEGLTPNNKVGAGPRKVAKKAKKGVHVWTDAERRAQARRMKARWKNGDFEGKVKKPHLVHKRAA